MLDGGGKVLLLAAGDGVDGAPLVRVVPQPVDDLSPEDACIGSATVCASTLTAVAIYLSRPSRLQKP